MKRAFILAALAIMSVAAMAQSMMTVTDTDGNIRKLKVDNVKETTFVNAESFEIKCLIGAVSTYAPSYLSEHPDHSSVVLFIEAKGFTKGYYVIDPAYYWNLDGGLDLDETWSDMLSLGDEIEFGSQLYNDLSTKGETATIVDGLSPESTYVFVIVGENADGSRGMYYEKFTMPKEGEVVNSPLLPTTGPTPTTLSDDKVFDPVFGYASLYGDYSENGTNDAILDIYNMDESENFYLQIAYPIADIKAIEGTYTVVNNFNGVAYTAPAGIKDESGWNPCLFTALDSDYNMKDPRAIIVGGSFTISLVSGTQYRLVASFKDEKGHTISCNKTISIIFEDYTKSE